MIVEVVVVDPLSGHFDDEKGDGARDEILNCKKLVFVLDAKRKPPASQSNVGDGKGKIKVELGVLGGREIAFELVEELDSSSECSVDGGVTASARVCFERS